MKKIEKWSTKGICVFLCVQYHLIEIFVFWCLFFLSSFSCSWRAIANKREKMPTRDCNVSELTEYPVEISVHVYV